MCTNKNSLNNLNSELETFSGYLVRKAKELSVPIPLSESMYSDLKRIAAEQYSHQKGKL